MSQKSSLPQAAKSVSQVLMSDMRRRKPKGCEHSAAAAVRDLSRAPDRVIK